MQKYPVYIPSKDRHSTATTNIPGAVWVVEPSEYDLYRASRRGVIALPKNDGGISFVRNHIKQMASDSGHARFWMIDDDISAFGFVKNGKCITREPGEILEMAEERLKNCHLGSLGYRQFAWASEGKLAVGRFCTVAVLVDCAFCRPLTYRNISCKEDIDFSMQVIAAGGVTASALDLWFSCPTIGSNAGGLKPHYDKRVDEDSAKKLARYWPGMVEIKNKRGRLDAFVNWKKLAEISR